MKRIMLGPGRSRGGSAAAEVVIAAAMLVFIILPVFSAVMEKYVLARKASIIRDALDMTNIAVYNALNAADLGMVRIDAVRSKAMDVFTEILSANLRLDGGLYPEPESIAEGRVEVVTLEIFCDGFPVTCPDGSVITRPCVHSGVRIPIRPSLYSAAVLRLLGSDFIVVFVHVDSEIPVNN